jgi:alkylated DNA repair dioxygenase AlkB
MTGDLFEPDAGIESRQQHLAPGAVLLRGLAGAASQSLVLVWGGPARLNYHGVLPVKAAHHPFAGTHRINLTLRRAA